MAKTAINVCAFCGQKAGGKLGGLRNTPDKGIFAHHDCLIFSPQVFTKDSGYESEFDIHSVMAEIRRGRTLKCSYCKNPGATIGCDIKQCQKTYHYECVKKDGGIRDESQYIVFCSRHANKREGIESSRTPDCSSTSHENNMQGKRKCISTLGNCSSQRENKKNSAALDSERSTSSECPSTSYGDRTLRKRKRKSELGLTSNQNIKHTRKTGDNSKDQQIGINDTSNGNNFKTASVSASKAWSSRLRNSQARLTSRIFNKKSYNQSNSDIDDCFIVKDQVEITRDDDPDGMEPESSPMSNKVGQCRVEKNKAKTNWSKTMSLAVSNKVMESSRDEDQHGMQCESCTSSLHNGENCNRMEMESPEPDLFSDSGSNRSVLVLPEITCQGHMQNQTDDADVGFAINLIQFLRQVPEDKKLSTQIAILNVFFSVLGQQPMSTSNPDCVPQQYTNPSPSRLNGQTPKE